MRTFLLICGVILSLLLASCSNDSVDDPPAGEPESESESIDEVDDAPEADDETEPGDNTEDLNTEDNITVDPIAAGQEIDDLIAEASVDGVVTGEELTEILEVSGVPAAQATCEGTLLAQLGITDPTDIDALRAAAATLTDEQRIELSTCIGGG